MNDYENLKKKYGERFAKFCRSNFPTILEEEGKLSSIIESKFYPSKNLYDDLMNQCSVDSFTRYIYSLAGNHEENIELVKVETPEILFDRAGYILFKCKTNDDVLSFKKYYKYDEELCTFRDPNRINNNHIFFAVKKNVDNIFRDDFKNPQRQDEYGTSVISLQFNKKNNYLSIKNRYNHTVGNPDATFNNNLENIMPGLTKSFEKHYGIKQASKEEDFELASYVEDIHGKLYKYSYEKANVYYCPNNIIITNGVVTKLDKNRYELIDYFLIDKEKKTIKCLVDDDYDSFTDFYKDIEKIEITKGVNGARVIKITNKNQDESFITINKENQIIKYKNDNITKIENDFLSGVFYLKEFSAKNLKSVGNYFLMDCDCLAKLYAPQLEEVGNKFLYKCDIEELSLPSLKRVGHRFIAVGDCLHKFDAPNLETVGDSFLMDNSNLYSLSLPSLKKVGASFMAECNCLEEVYFPELESVETYFLYKARNIKYLNLPKLKIMPDYFMYCCANLQEFNAPMVERIEEACLFQANKLEALNIPKCKKIGGGFACYGYKLSELNLESVEIIGEEFLKKNKELKSFIAPNLKEFGNELLADNKVLRKIKVPQLSNINVKKWESASWLKDNFIAKIKINYALHKNQKRLKKQQEQER